MLGNFLIGDVFNLEVFKHDFNNPVAIFEQVQIIFKIASRDQLRIAVRHERRRVGFEHFLNRALGNLAAVFACRQILWHDIEQHYRDASIGNLRGDSASHHT